MYKSLEINVLYQNRYLYNLKEVYITENQRTSSKYLFYNLKQVYISGNQRTL